MPAPVASYFSLSRSPRYSLTFAVPLLVLYEGLAIAIGDGMGGLRNGADVLLKALFALVAGPHGPLIFGALLIGTVIAIVVRDARRNPGPLRPRVFAAMLAESAVLAVVFGVVVGTITARLVAAARPSPQDALARVGWPEAMTLSLGAGLYEELLFRVLLVGALVAAGKHLLRLRPTAAGGIAVAVGALVFAAYHYVGRFGDTFALGSFVFRTVAGLAFSALYVTRGFGITAWTHALYDAFLTGLRSGSPAG